MPTQVDNKFRIHHPPLAFTFAESDDIADQVKTFCTMPTPWIAAL